MGSASKQKLSGIQKQVLSLYRGFLRAARSKGPEERCRIESIVSNEFRKNSRGVDRKDFLYIEYLLRRGKKQLEQLKNPETLGLSAHKGQASEQSKLSNKLGLSRVPIIPLVWKRPETGCLTMNFDGAALNNPGPAGAGSIIRNESGQLVAARMRFLGSRSNTLAEFEALNDGLELAYVLGIRKLEIVGDSSLVINVITRKADPPWFTVHVVARIRSRLNGLEWAARHVYRELNEVADTLAKKAAKDNSTQAWSGITPEFIKQKLDQDISGFVRYRLCG